MFRSMLAIATAALLTIALPSEGTADNSGLRPLATADSVRGWEGVGRLNFGDGGFCTASLVAPDMVLTAAHCLFDERTGRRMDISRLEFQAGLRNGKAEAYRGIARAVIHPSFNFGRGTKIGRVGADLALLQLDRPVQLSHVRPFRTQSQVRSGQSVQVISYAQHRAAAPSREEACAVLTRDRDVLVLSCSVDFGASGAPVFATVNGELRIVSVISAKARWSNRPVALAASMEGEIDALFSAFDNRVASVNNLRVEDTRFTAGRN
ncbi:MAG: trypsin-like serine protease [Jannaschia sp.]